MTDTLFFPGLGLEFQLNPVALQLGDTWSIHWYGVIMALALFSAAGYVLRKVKLFGLDENRVIDVIVGGVFGGILGARIYYIMFNFDAFRGDFASFFRIWQGGIAIYGGLIGGVLVGTIICKVRKVKILPMYDLAVGGIFIGQIVGRWGNFVNMEAFGSNTTLPWGMTSATITNFLTHQQSFLAEKGVFVDPLMPVHPTFLYESLWNLIGFIFVLKYTPKRRFDGELALFYLGWYGAGRFLIEGLRTDSLMLGNIRISQAVALICVIVAVTVTLYIRGKIKKSGDPDYLKPFAFTADGHKVIAGTFYKENPAAEKNDIETITPNRRRVISKIRTGVWAKQKLRRITHPNSQKRKIHRKK